MPKVSFCKGRNYIQNLTIINEPYKITGHLERTMRNVKALNTSVVVSIMAVAVAAARRAWHVSSSEIT
jgi:hypothetical protein